MTDFLVGGVILIIIGVCGFHWVGRRKFYRRNQVGMEGFESYGKAITTSMLEGLINKCSFVAIGLGLLFLLGWGFGSVVLWNSN